MGCYTYESNIPGANSGTVFKPIVATNLIIRMAQSKTNSRLFLPDEVFGNTNVLQTAKTFGVVLALRSEMKPPGHEGLAVLFEGASTSERTGVVNAWIGVDDKFTNEVYSFSTEKAGNWEISQVDKDRVISRSEVISSFFMPEPKEPSSEKVKIETADLIFARIVFADWLSTSRFTTEIPIFIDDRIYRSAGFDPAKSEGHRIYSLSKWKRGYDAPFLGALSVKHVDQTVVVEALVGHRNGIEQYEYLLERDQSGKWIVTRRKGKAAS